MVLFTIRAIFRSQCRNLLALMQRRPVTTPSLGSMTLGLDDVAIAKGLLRNSKVWLDETALSEFEHQFKMWNGSQYAFAFMSGRVALSACLYALQLEQGDEVIVPGYTCVVVPNAIRYAGLKPVFVDIELGSYGLDSEKIEENITQKTKAIVLHHLYGLVCRDYEKIIAIARKHNLKVIEDCAHSTGAEFKGKKVGNLGDLAFYSTEQSKVLNTIQGGVATSNLPELGRMLREYYLKCPFPEKKMIHKQLCNVILNYYQFAAPSRWWQGDVAELLLGRHRLTSTSKEEMQGIKPDKYGQRMPAAIASIGINQLSKLDSINRKRVKTAKKWDAWCQEKGYTKPFVVENSVPVFLRYPVLVDKKEKQDLAWAHRELGVRPGVWFISNLHPASIKLDNCPRADEAVRRCINLPCLGVI